MNDYLALGSGVLCAGIGGELFVRGLVGLGRAMRISPGIVGTTFAAFATSSPELSVAVSSALAGAPEISLGDALGSNIVNVALILAVATLISAIRAPRDSVKRDFPAALLAPILIGLLAFDGVLSRTDGAVLLGAFLLWLIAAVIEAKRQRSVAEELLGEHRSGFAGVLSFAGLALLMAAGYLIVTGTRGLATALGIDNFVIGATLVAVGTSIPELATAVVSKLRGHDEVGLGTILGSNIFNTLFIVGVAATIFPIRIAWSEISVTLFFGIAAVAVTYPVRDGNIGRGRGFLLLFLYVLYVTMLL